MVCVPSPLAITELRNAWPLMVPLTGTRALEPNTVATSNGTERQVHAPPGPRAISLVRKDCFTMTCASG